MKFRIRFADQVVGVFVLIAVVAVAAILILMGLNQRWFAKDYHFTSKFSSAQGISSGMAITLKGFQIGKVKQISLGDDNKVTIDFVIFDTYYTKVKKNSVLQLASSPIGLGGGMVFHPGKDPGGPLSENSFIPSMDSAEGKALIAQGLVDLPLTEDVINGLIGRIGPVLENVNTVLVSITTLSKTLNDNFSGSGGSGPVKDLLASIRGTVQDANTTIQNINSVLARTSDNVNVVLEDTTKKVNTLLGNIDTIVKDLRQITENPKGLVKTLLDPKGSIATLLDDNNALMNQIQGILKQLNDTTDQIRKFTAYLTSSQPQITGLLEGGRKAIDQGKDVLEGIRNNPLIRGGIPEKREQPTTFQGYRSEDF